MKKPKNPFHPGEILLEEFLYPGEARKPSLQGSAAGHGRG
jgi:plasmid maintenance system antidote protein VapI